MHNLEYSSYDLIAHIRPTTPQRNVSDIDRAIKIFAMSKYNSLRSVHEMSETAYKSFEIYKKNELKPIANLKCSLDDLNKPRQSFKSTYMANGVIDIYRKKFIVCDYFAVKLKYNAQRAYLLKRIFFNFFD